MTTPRHIFRISFWRPWLFALALLALLAALGAAISALTGNPGALFGILPAVVVAAVVLILPISLAVRTSQWDVDRDGIGGRNNWHVYHRLGWDEIDSIEPWLIPGYRYLQINGGGRRWAFWLPLFLTDMSGFRSAVVHYAPHDNPLRRYLEKNRA